MRMEPRCEVNDFPVSSASVTKSPRVKSSVIEQRRSSGELGTSQRVGSWGPSPDCGRARRFLEFLRALPRAPQSDFPRLVFDIKSPKTTGR
jgi:hypothetical protein